MVKRTERVLGFPIKVYDNGKTVDRYTVIFYHDFTKNNTGGYDYLAMAESTNTFCLNGEGAVCGKHLGKKISFNDLPLSCKYAVKDDIRYFKKCIRDENRKTHNDGFSL